MIPSDLLFESTSDFEKGDTILVGRFKNVKAIVKGFGKDKHNQPIVKTNKGKYNLYRFRIQKLMKESYDPPMDLESVKKKYPHLLKDETHHWRAKTGIELIHKEPSYDEQMRIWKNWNQMSPEMKKKSDKKSIELFKMTNKEHHEQLIKKHYNHIHESSGDEVYDRVKKNQGSDYWENHKAVHINKEPEKPKSDLIKNAAIFGAGAAVGAGAGYAGGKFIEKLKKPKYQSVADLPKVPYHTHPELLNKKV